VADRPAAGGPRAGSDGPSRAAPAFETAPEYEVYEVPLGRLLGSVLLSGAVVWFGLLVVGLAVLSVTSGGVGSALLALPMVLTVVSLVWSRVNSGASFRAATSPDGIRLRHGLTESRAQTVPPGRVQAVSIHQGRCGGGRTGGRVQMNVAGYGNEQSSGEHESVLHPVATRDEARTALWLVLPDLGVPDPVATLDAALTGTGTDGGFVAAPRRSVWVDPIGWRRHGVLVTDRALILRSGRFWRRVVVVPHERTQSLGSRRVRSNGRCAWPRSCCTRPRVRWRLGSRTWMRRSRPICCTSRRAGLGWPARPPPPSSGCARRSRHRDRSVGPSRQARRRCGRCRAGRRRPGRRAASRRSPGDRLQRDLAGLA